MADLDDVRRLALALPETAEHGSYGGAPAWQVRGRAFVWERPLRRAELAALGDRAPAGPVLGAYVADLGDKEALLGAEPQAVFTTPHFDGHASVLVRLAEVTDDALQELVVDAWLARAPKRLAAAYLAQSSETKTQSG